MQVPPPAAPEQTLFYVTGDTCASTRDAVRATYRGCRGIARDTLGHLAVSDGDAPPADDTGNLPYCKQPGSDDSGRA